MGRKRRRWSRRRKLLVWGVIAATILGILLFGLRAPWIAPIPGVSVEMTRPFTREGNLGPSSAYRLFLTALAEIAKAEVADPDDNVRGSYVEVLEKVGITVVRGGAPPPAGDLFPESLAEQQQAAETKPVRVWSGGWGDALDKLTHHPWPTAPPPAAPPKSPDSPPTGMLGAADESDPHHLAIRREAPWTLEQYEQILHGLALHRPAIPLLDRALTAPNPRVPTVGPWPRGHWVRSLCAWLVISAHTHAATGDYAEARRDLQRSLATAALFTRGGSSSDHLAAWARGGLISVAAKTIAIRHAIPPAILHEMAADLLHQTDSAEPFVECIRAELLSLRNFVPAYYSDHPLGSGSGSERYVAGLAFAVARLAGSTPDKTVRNLESLFQHWVVLAQKPYSAAVQDEYDAIKEGWCPKRTIKGLVLGTRDPLGYHMASRVIDTPDRLHACSATHVALLRGTALFLAVRAYELEHGGLPDSVEQLVPTHLPQLPVDPFSGKPFRYLRSGVPGLSPDAWAIYSVGTNCADDGGTAYAPSSLSPYGEPDLVIASQNYPREWQLRRPPRKWYPGGRSKPRFECRGDLL